MKTEEENNVQLMILRLSEENKKCAIAAAEALLYAQNEGEVRPSENELAGKGQRG